MDPKEVARSILQGVKDGIQGANLQFLKTVRIVMLKINVFLAFKEMTQHILGINTHLSGEYKSVRCINRHNIYNRLN